MTTVVILFLYIVLMLFIIIHKHCGNDRQLSLVCELKMYASCVFF